MRKAMDDWLCDRCMHEFASHMKRISPDEVVCTECGDCHWVSYSGDERVDMSLVFHPKEELVWRSIVS